MINFLKSSKNKPNKYHWYEIRFIYKDKLNKEVFNFTNQIGLFNQSDILKHRVVKKTPKPIHLLGVNKSLLKNGQLSFEICCYLGHF